MKNVMLISLLIIPVLLSAQQSGNILNLRVITDANNYLLVTSGVQTLPLSQPTTLSNARLRTDSSGNLLVVFSQGSGFVSSITGTSGQITVTPTTGAATISLPSLVGINNTTPTSNLSIQGTTGGGSYITRKIAQNIISGTGLYDVGMRLTKSGNNSYSLLDIDILNGAGGGKSIRFFNTVGSTRSMNAYFLPSAAFYTRTGIVISGTFTNSIVNDGEDTNITPPSLDPTMLGIWNDVVGGVQVRAYNGAGAWLWEGLDRNGNKTSSILEDGSYLFGAGATHASLDTGISRLSAGLLQINSGTIGTLRDLNLRNIIGQTGYDEKIEMLAPSNPSANTVRIYAEDNGAGKTRLMAIFPSGIAQQIAIEP